MSSTDHIDVGEVVRITNGDGFKTKPAGTLFDPVDVELTLRTPSGTTVDLTDDVQTSSTGLYYADYTPDESGIHWYRWNGDSVIEQNRFVVVDRMVPAP
jgi:hypothetical protein